MTDPDGILQLGIEAAHDGNNEEARNLFRLLTNEDPQNVQGWLWLAGVAENPAERRAALERVVELDPNNDMARKSLHVMTEKAAESPPESAAPPHDEGEPEGLEFGFDFAEPAAFAHEPPPPDEPAAPPPIVPTQPPRHEPAAARPDNSEFDDPFAELDSLSDAFSGSPDAVGRSRVSSSEEQSAMAGHEPPQGAEDHRPGAPQKPERRPSPSIPKLSGLARIRAKGEHGAKGDERQMSRKPLLIGVLGLLGVVLIIFLVWQFVWPIFFGGEPEIAGGPPPAQEQPTSPPTGEQPAGGGEGEEPAQPTTAEEAGEQPAAAGGPTEAPPEPTPEATATPETPRPAEPTPEPEPASPDTPFAPPTAEGTGDIAANPSIIPPNTPIESNGWLYDFNQNLCLGSCAVDFIGPVAGIQPQGRFVQVLIAVVNRTGTDQPLPNDFLVLKDAQGRVYNTRPDVSEAFVIPNVNADRSMQDPIPANGLTTSVALFFDVAPDATDLVLYAPGRPDQGWRVLPSLR